MPEGDKTPGFGPDTPEICSDRRTRVTSNKRLARAHTPRPSPPVVRRIETGRFLSRETSRLRMPFDARRTCRGSHARSSRSFRTDATDDTTRKQARASWLAERPRICATFSLENGISVRDDHRPARRDGTARPVALVGRPVYPRDDRKEFNIIIKVTRFSKSVRAERRREANVK